MRENIEAKPIADERIQRIVVAINAQVFPQLLRTKNEDALILKFEVFDDG